jgi:multidrug efflux pump subunit AcrB
MSGLAGNIKGAGLLPGRLSAFTINIIFVVLIIGGISLAPLTSFKFLPSRTLPSITVTFSWPNISGRIIEMEVTGQLEAAFSTVRGIREISSQSARGSGSINISFDKTTDMDATRFEIAALIRQVYPGLPEGVSRPLLTLNRPDDRETALLTYTINANTTVYTIGRYGEDVIKRRLSDIPGVYSVNIAGMLPFEWELEYDTGKLYELGLEQNTLRTAIGDYLRVHEMGQVLTGRDTESENRVNLLFRGNNTGSFRWEDIPVGVSGDRIIRLTEVVRPAYIEQRATRYYRINGLSTVNMTIVAERGANHLTVAGEVKERINRLRNELPQGFSITIAHDSTEYLRNELNKNIFRTGFSLVLLLLFVYLVTLQRRYLLIVAISLLANIIIGFIFYYLLGVEIHLYSLAGITVSLGILIDNTIVMIDHLRHKKNLKVFIALLAATLTTIGALTVIFFLDEGQRVNLTDFAMVVIINLSICLFIALFFVPALMEKIPLQARRSARMIKRKRMAAAFNGRYRRYIRFGRRYKVAFIIAGILGFGLPVFWLPEKLEGERSYHTLYNSTLGSETYTKTIKPVSDKVLGGALRLFVYHVSERSYFTQPERTRLWVRAYLPEGSTIEHANFVMQDFENFLARFDEVEQYHTRVNGPESGSIEIHFRREHENTFFPFRLKSLLEQKAIYSGGADFGVFGVGQGFSNRMWERATPGIRLTGYNYELLTGFARDIAARLEANSRIQRVHIQSQREVWQLNLRTEYYMDFDREALARLGYTIPGVYSHLTGLFIHESPPFGELSGGEYLPMRLRSAGARELGLWEVQNTMIGGTGGKGFKIGEIAGITRTRAPDVISKLNQQYFVTLMYDFIGPHELGGIVRDREIDEANSILPLGFRAFDPREGMMWRLDDKKQYGLIFLVIVIIFFICAILLESLWQPLAVILMLPLSYIGVFLTFYLFNFNFDQGGYAAFLFLSGIVVNSALYILNDMNNLRKSNPGLTGINRYIKAYNAKIIPILLTVISTVLGLTPFLLGGRTESFWFALAAGTIGGLLFSLAVLLVFLPLLVKNGMRADRMFAGDYSSGKTSAK